MNHCALNYYTCFIKRWSSGWYTRDCSLLSWPVLQPCSDRSAVRVVQSSAPQIWSSGSRALVAFYPTRWLIAFTCHPGLKSAPDHQHRMKIVWQSWIPAVLWRLQGVQPSHTRLQSASRACNVLLNLLFIRELQNITEKGWKNKISKTF